jgi:hypothetical protein
MLRVYRYQCGSRLLHLHDIDADNNKNVSFRGEGSCSTTCSGFIPPEVLVQFVKHVVCISVAGLSDNIWECTTNPFLKQGGCEAFLLEGLTWNRLKGAPHGPLKFPRASSES